MLAQLVEQLTNEQKFKGFDSAMADHWVSMTKTIVCLCQTALALMVEQSTNEHKFKSNLLFARVTLENGNYLPLASLTTKKVL